MIRKLISHMDIIFAGMLLVLLIIDSVNSAMQFIDNGHTKRLIGLLCLCSIASGVMLRAKPPVKRRTGSRAPAGGKAPVKTVKTNKQNVRR